MASTKPTISKTNTLDLRTRLRANDIFSTVALPDQKIAILAYCRECGGVSHANIILISQGSGTSQPNAAANAVGDDSWETTIVNKVGPAMRMSADNQGNLVVLRITSPIIRVFSPGSEKVRDIDVDWPIPPQLFGGPVDLEFLSILDCSVANDNIYALVRGTFSNDLVVVFDKDGAALFTCELPFENFISMSYSKKTGKVYVLADDGHVEQYGWVGDRLERVYPKPQGTLSLKDPQGQFNAYYICVRDNSRHDEEVFIIGTWNEFNVVGLFREFRNGTSHWTRQAVDFGRDVTRTVFPYFAVRDDNVFIYWASLARKRSSENDHEINVYKLNG